MLEVRGLNAFYGESQVLWDVFPNPADGGRPPYEIYLRAVESGRFADVRAVG